MARTAVPGRDWTGLFLKLGGAAALGLGAWAAYVFSSPERAERYKLGGAPPSSGPAAATRAGPSSLPWLQGVGARRDVSAPVDAAAGISPRPSSSAPMRLAPLQGAAAGLEGTTEASGRPAQAGAPAPGASEPAASAAAFAASPDPTTGSAPGGRRPYRVYGNVGRDKIMGGPPGRSRTSPARACRRGLSTRRAARPAVSVPGAARFQGRMGFRARRTRRR